MRSISSYVSESVAFTPAIVEATKSFARSKPWRGTLSVRKEKFQNFHTAMCQACEVKSELVFVHIPGLRRSAGSVVAGRLMLAENKLSAVTYLYWFAELIYGRQPDQQMTFAVNLFKQRFPRSFAACDVSGPLVR